MNEEQENWAKMERAAFRERVEKSIPYAPKQPSVWQIAGIIALCLTVNLGLFYVLLLMVKRVFFK